ncbi:MAG: hypothetical protein ABR577_10565 [Pyrinomonadaceae bacterium]
MNEFEDTLAKVLVEAERRARLSGRGDVAEYLHLRASNDALRAAGIEWLTETFEWLAAEINRAGNRVEIEHQTAHHFSIGAATMVGTSLTLRKGVRALTIEAGWPRAPQHGIVRGGGLAHARIKHFGERGISEELLLIRSEDGAPRWFVIGTDDARTQFMETRAYQHVAKLFGA